MIFDLVLKGGHVLVGSHFFLSDIAVAGQTIAALGSHLSSDKVCPIFNIKRRRVLPLLSDFSSFSYLISEGKAARAVFEEVSRSSISNGIRYRAETVFQEPYETLSATVGRINSSMELDKPGAFLGTSVYISSSDIAEIADVQQAQKMGLRALFFDFERLSEETIAKWLRRAAESKLPAIISTCHLHWGAQEKGENIPLSCSKLDSELMAVMKAITLAKLTSAPVLIWGVTCEESLQVIVDYQKQDVLVYPIIHVPHLLSESEGRLDSVPSKTAPFIPPLRDVATAKKLLDCWLTLRFTGLLTLGAFAFQCRWNMSESCMASLLLHELVHKIVKISHCTEDEAWVRLSSGFDMFDRMFPSPCGEFSQLMVGNSADWMVVPVLSSQEVSQFFKGPPRVKTDKSVLPEMVIIAGQVLQNSF